MYRGIAGPLSANALHTADMHATAATAWLVDAAQDLSVAEDEVVAALPPQMAIAH